MTSTREIVKAAATTRSVRAARPTPAAAAPITVTDSAAPAVLGLTARQFRAMVREHGVPHATVGRRTIVRVDRLLDVIDRLSGAAPRAAWSEADIIARAAGGR